MFIFGNGGEIINSDYVTMIDFSYDESLSLDTGIKKYDAIAICFIDSRHGSKAVVIWSKKFDSVKERQAAVYRFRESFMHALENKQNYFVA